MSARLALLLAVVATVPALAPAHARAAEPVPRPMVAAPVAILVEPATGDVVFQRRAGERRAIASTTKLMTALITLEHSDLADVMTAVRYQALPAESVIGLRAGERLTVADLLRGLLLASANDAAVTLAAGVGGSQRAFVRMMNARARELGLSQTHFANPIGLDEKGNHSSASDLVKLALILRRDPFVRRVTDLPRATLRTGARRRVVVNRNRLVRTTPLVDGVKTGHTRQAGYVLVGAAERDGVSLISAVLGDPSEAARDGDTLALLRYGLRLYRRATLVGRRAYARLDADAGDGSVPVVASRVVRRVIRRGDRVATRVTGLPEQLEGPLPRGVRVGTLEVRWRGRTIDRVALLTARAVPAPSIADRAGGVLGVSALVLACVAAALGSLHVVLRRRRARRERRRSETGIA